MKAPLLAIAAATLLAATVLPAAAQTPSQPRDVGNMAYPTPLPQGNVGGTPAAGRDTGSMAYPSSTPAVAGSAPSNTPGPRAGDTNSSQFQAPLPQGNIGTTVVK